MSQRIALIGGGWAGLAAAVDATAQGHCVSLFDMAPQLGGRARSLASTDDTHRLDNGQHILIGAYTATLTLMRQVGVDPDRVMLRLPLTLLDSRGVGLRLGRGPALLAFSIAVCRLRHWSLRERAALNLTSLGWLLRRFRCAESITVAQLCIALPPRVQREFIEPLCVAALNTPADAASARVFLRVLRDALFSGPGSSDLLIPRRPLADLLPEPARAWLNAHGAQVRLGQRVQVIERITRPTSTWSVDGEPFDRVVLACSASEAARLTQAIAPAWSAQAASFGYEPIVTAYIQAPRQARLIAPMITLAEGPDAPAQFAFDHGALGATPGRFAFVVSGAAPWVARGLEATGAAALAQAREALPGTPADSIRLLKTVAEKRATFRCVPGMVRPAAAVDEGLMAAGDYVDGPYPATLEGAVRSGLAAVAR